MNNDSLDELVLGSAGDSTSLPYATSTCVTAGTKAETD